MLENILGYSLLGNDILQYVYFLGIFLVFFILAKFVYWIFTKTFFALTAKTKTRLDDLIVHSLHGPIVGAVLLVGFRVASLTLELSDAGKIIYQKIFGVALTLIISWFIMRIVDALIQNYIKPYTKKSKNKFDDTLFPVVKSFVNFSIITLTIILILQNLGFQVTSLIAGLGIGGLAFAFAAKDVLANMFGGAAILADKPFHVGDRLKVDGQDGTVKKITLRSTTLQTFGGTTVVMPNSRIADSTLENISSEKMRRIKLVLGLTYDTSSKKLDQAKQIVTKIIKKNPDVDNNLHVAFNNFGASSLDIMVIYYIIDLNNILSIKDKINSEIKIEFDKARLNFAFPSQSIYIEKK